MLFMFLFVYNINSYTVYELISVNTSSVRSGFLIASPTKQFKVRIFFRFDKMVWEIKLARYEESNIGKSIISVNK